MKDLAQRALNAAEIAGATYADIRIITEHSEDIEVKDGHVGSINRGTSSGFGIRVIAGGAWGFASSPKIEKSEIERVAKLAVKVARASAMLKVKDVDQAPVEKYVDRYVTPHKKNPLDVSLEDKIALLLQADGIMRKVKGVNITESRIAAWVEDQLFASTVGSLIEQRIVQCGGGYTATAIRDGDVQYRSYPCSHDGQWESSGHEMIEQLDFAGHAEQTAEEAVALLSAVQCPSGVKDIIIEGSQLSLQIHESIGHPLELDRVFGSEANMAGTSFATTDKLDKLKYGSDIVTIVSDPTCPMGLGSFGYDDEGVKARKIDLIKNGLLVNYLSSRESAKVIGKDSTGAMRADGWGNMPIVRMTCINLEPGAKPLAQIIAGTDDGIYMATNKSFSIDDRRSNFQFGTEIAWEIKRGKLGRMFKNATYTGITPQFWNACDAVAGQGDWKIWGTANCGKGEPSQTARTAQGCAPARFRKIKVGVVPGKSEPIHG